MEAVRYSLSADDYVAYSRRICERGSGMSMATIILVVATLSLAGGGPGNERDVLIGAGVAFALVALYIFVLVPRYARGMFLEHKAMKEAKTLTVEGTGAKFCQKSGSYRLDWGDIHKWDETDRLLALYVNRAAFILIPKPDIGEDVTARIKELLIQSGLPAPRQRRSDV